MADTVAGPDEQLTRERGFGAGRKARTWILLAVGGLLFCIWALLSGWTQPLRAVDLEQSRLNVALPPPQGEQTIVQTFRARHDGLDEVEILLARHGETQPAQGQLTLSLLDDAGGEIASRSWLNARLTHNQPLVLRFAPQPASRGALFRLVVAGEGENSFGAWAYDLNVLEGGELASGGEGDLRFTTRYALTATAAFQRLTAILAADGPILLLSLLVLPLPGCLLLLAARERLPALNGATWWSLALGLGLAGWPMLWFWLTLAGGRWTRGALWAALAAGWIVVVVLFVRGWRRRGHMRRRMGAGAFLHDALLVLLLITTLGVRLLAIRDLAFPPWVDSSRHALITAVMWQQGQTPDGYQPFLPVDEFQYHFGFHTLATTVQMLGDTPLPRTLLILGQLLNALAPLAIYGAAWMLTRRRSAALLAAFLVALPFFFPAYYVTWGRFTQLTGALVLAPLLAMTWLLLRGARGWRRAWWVVGILVGGLFLIHVRVFLVYLPFALLAWLAVLGRGRRGMVTTHLGAAALAAALAGPRLWQLLSGAAVGQGYLSSSGESYAEFPVGYVTTGWERWFLLAGGVLFLLLAFAAMRGHRRALAGVVLGGWGALVVLLLSGRVAGLPVLWLINLNSAYILAFVPLSLLLALGFAWLWRRVQANAWSRAAGALLLGAAVGAFTSFGIRQQLTIVNETTVLAREADAPALAWMAQHLPEEARVAVNSWRWLGETWAAGDGGAWIVPLTGREATTPPVDYIGERRLFEEVIAFNEGAMKVADWSAPQAATWLVEQGVTHVYVGARGGFLDPAALARNPRLEMVYGRDGVFVFEVGGVGIRRMGIGDGGFGIGDWGIGAGMAEL